MANVKRSRKKSLTKQKKSRKSSRVTKIKNESVKSTRKTISSPSIARKKKISKFLKEIKPSPFELLLHDIQIDDEKVDILTKEIQSNKTINVVDFKEVEIGFTKAQTIAKAIKKNKAIQFVWVHRSMQHNNLFRAFKANNIEVLSFE